MQKLLFAAALQLLLAFPAFAAVSGATPSGFLVTHKATVNAPPPKVFAAFPQVARWWNSEHTYSGNATALSLDPRAGGCFCERWNQDSIEHGRVLYVAQGKALRIEASLGPLQEMAVNGILHFALEAAGSETALTMTYRVRGSPDAALDKVAGVVDRVLGEQLQRLIRFVETGSAVPAPPREPLAERFFDSEGVRLRYVEEGRGPDAVVLLHDAGSDIDAQWLATGFFETLARQQIFRVIALDLRGHGKSAAGPGEGTELADDVLRLMSHLGVERAHLIGFGRGAQVAAYLTVRHPRRVITATLAAGAHARRGGLAVTDEEMNAIRTPTLAAVGSLDPAIGEMHALRRAMPQLWRFAVLHEETRATMIRGDEFITLLQYFLRYHPGRQTK